jgi:hypothetical protein
LRRQQATSVCDGYLGRITSSRINWFDGAIDDGIRFACADFTVALPNGARRSGPARLGIRPHDLTLVDLAHGALGATLLVHARSQHGVALRLVVPADAVVRRGNAIGAQVAADRAHLFDPQTGLRL